MWSHMRCTSQGQTPRPNFGNALAFVLYLGVASTKQVQQVKCGGKALLQEEDGSLRNEAQRVEIACLFPHALFFQ